MSLIRLGFLPILGLLPLLGFGCSDPVPPTPRGAFDVRFYSPSFTTCPHNTHVGTIGQVTATSKTVVVDGESGASVDCEVKASGGGFSVSANASGTDPETGNAYTLRFSIGSISASATVDAPATGNVAFQSTQLGEPAQSNANGCMFFFDPAQAENARVSEGKIWVSFVCPELNINTNVCEIDQAWAVFENCDTGAAE